MSRESIHHVCKIWMGDWLIKTDGAVGDPVFNRTEDHMKDNELRGIILQKFYDVRHETDDVNLGNLAGWFPEIEPNVIFNICEQLVENGFITWMPIYGNLRTFRLGKITSEGIDVIEGNKAPPISIHVNNSQNVQIGEQNIQNVNFDIGKLIAAVDHSNASDSEKQKAKSILQSLLENPIIQAVWRNVFGTSS